MSKVFEFTGGDDFFGRGFLHGDPKESSLFLSLASQLDVYFPPRKRSRISAPFIVNGGEQEQQPTIETLPDECLFEVFRRLPGGQERSSCACVSKRWLMLLSTIRRDETCVPATTQPVDSEIRSNSPNEVKSADPKEKGELVDLNEIPSEDEECPEIYSHGCLSRSLEGKKATDVRLAAISVGTANPGGLGKLSIRGNKFTSNVTDFGLKAVSHGCPSLRVLSLWNLPSVSDEGLSAIATSCHSLEKLDLSRCPAITDRGLAAIAANCPNLKTVSIESCSNIGDNSLQALGRHCSNLKSVTVRNCPLVGDRGVASLMSSAGQVLEKVNFQLLDITDVSLAVIGHYGSALTDLVLGGLSSVNDRGFWVMGKGQGLQKLHSLAIYSCPGVSDAGMESVGIGCPSLKQYILRKCSLVSDKGLASFAKAACSLESLQLEECHGITQHGVFSVLSNCGRLKALALENCFGTKDVDFGFQPTSLCYSLRSLTFRNCPGIGNVGLAMLGKLCPNLTHLNLTGLQGITDSSILPLIRGLNAGLRKVNLSGCINVTDSLVVEITKLHGATLEVLNLDGCNVTNQGLVAIARNCSILSELDISKCAVSDSGISVLAKAEQLSLQILSLAGCTHVTDKSLPSLGVIGKTLAGLNIQQCCGISHGAINVLLEHLWRCDILY